MTTPGRRRVAIVGLSWIAADPPAAAPAPGLTGHLHSHASAYAGQPDVEVVAVCDLSAAAREAFVERWAPTWPDIATYSDHQQLLDAHDIEILSVVTPDHLHRGIVLDAIASGVRAIFCEKPLATTLDDADQMVSAAREAGVVVSVNYTRRWTPEYAIARKLVLEGAIGNPALITARFGGPRAMLFRNTTHYLDLMVFLAASEPVWVSSELDAGFTDYGVDYIGDGGHEPGSEPGSTSLIGFANGVRAFLSDSKSTIRQDIVEIVGTEGSLSIRDGILTLGQQQGNTIAYRVVPTKATQTGMLAAVRELIDSIDVGSPTASPPDQARHALALADGVLRSAHHGGSRIILADVAFD